MHASNCSQSGRRKINNEENENLREEKLDPIKERKAYKSRQTSSNDNSTEIYQAKLQIPTEDSPLISRSRSYNDLNTDYYNIAYTSDSIHDSFASNRLQSDDTNPTGVSNVLSTEINFESSYQNLERDRRRSGSWTGVNESDDEMEQISKHQSTAVNSRDPTLSQPCINYGSIPASTNSGTARTIISNSFSGVNNLETAPNDYQSSCETCSIDSTIVTRENINQIEEKIRKRLKFFFMNPVEKWQAKRRFPWKLLIQVIKIIIVTAQLCTFATQRYNHVSYLWDTKVSFSHLFIKGWDTSREVNAYPPSTGPLAIYNINGFYEFLDYTIKTFATVNESAVGTYGYEKMNGSLVMPSLCTNQYADTKIDLDNLSFELSSKIEHRCVYIPSSVFTNTSSWSTKKFLKEMNMTINFDLLSDASFNFKLRTIKIKPNIPLESPECFSLEASIYFDNNDHDGQMLVDMDIGAMVLDCMGSINTVAETKYLHSIRSSLNVLTIIICVLSCTMCMRSVYRALTLKNVTNKFFRFRFNRALTKWEKFDFVNLWYLLIIVNDLLIVFGSIIKISLEAQDYEGYLDKWNVCSLLLGTGNLFVWFGCLRYLGFFKTYNVLILTMKKCIPNVLRYSICIMMVFAGYCFCGWLVLGPYHLKFRSLSSSIECLYSLVNGDDMFATFSSTVGKDWIVWWFSRIYLYTFISLFIYIILSLFIAIIMDSYETITSCYERGFPKNDLMQFIGECQADPFSGAYMDSERTIQDFINRLFCCDITRPPTPGYEPLPT